MAHTATISLTTPTYHVRCSCGMELETTSFALAVTELAAHMGANLPGYNYEPGSTC